MLRWWYCIPAKAVFKVIEQTSAVALRNCFHKKQGNLLPRRSDRLRSAEWLLSREKIVCMYAVRLSGQPPCRWSGRWVSCSGAGIRSPLCGSRLVPSGVSAQAANSAVGPGNCYVRLSVRRKTYRNETFRGHHLRIR